jgi:hypothetical protein
MYEQVLRKDSSMHQNKQFEAWHLPRTMGMHSVQLIMLEKTNIKRRLRFSKRFTSTFIRSCFPNPVDEALLHKTWKFHAIQLLRACPP